MCKTSSPGAVSGGSEHSTGSVCVMCTVQERAAQSGAASLAAARESELQALKLSSTEAALQAALQAKEQSDQISTLQKDIIRWVGLGLGLPHMME